MQKMRCQSSDVVDGIANVRVCEAGRPLGAGSQFRSETLMPIKDSLLQGAKLRILCSSRSGERFVGCKGLLQLRFGRCHARRGNLTAEILLAGQ